MVTEYEGPDVVRRREPASPESAEKRAWIVVQNIPDPEIPVLSIVDLGIVRWIRLDGSGIAAGIAPTYSGCPAIEVIEQLVHTSLADAGFAPVTIERVLSPPWTTDRISREGIEKLADYGIAPPTEGATSKRALLGEDRPAACPHCGDTDTRMISEFGSTPCKAAWQCNACQEPFEYFKCI